MGRKELGNCIILTENDLKKIKGNLNNLIQIKTNMQIPVSELFYGPESKINLIEYIQFTSKLQMADIAIIKKNNFFDLYKYND